VTGSAPFHTRTYRFRKCESVTLRFHRPARLNSPENFRAPDLPAPPFSSVCAEALSSMSFPKWSGDPAGVRAFEVLGDLLRRLVFSGGDRRGRVTGPTDCRRNQDDGSCGPRPRGLQSSAKLRSLCSLLEGLRSPGPPNRVLLQSLNP
jgi:hypothetical protein